MTSLDNSATEERLLALHAWAAHVLRASKMQLTPLSGDASFRRYFRISDNADQLSGKYPALLAVDAPPATEDSAQFIAIAQTLARAGLNTPHIFFADTDNGFLIIEDFGDDLLSTILAATPDATDAYQLPLKALAQLQLTPAAPALLPQYDDALLRRELMLFDEWFVQGLLGYNCTDTDQALLASTRESLISSALDQPYVWVHRDYHSRNLLLCAPDKLGIIDFQGAVWGPITYDLVSLLKDCYWQLPRESVTQLALSHLTQLRAQGSLSEAISDTEFMRSFDLMGLQRHLKVLGIFARLHLRDHKSQYLQDLPRVLAYVRQAVAAHADTAPLADWIDRQLMPLIAQQPWYTGVDAQ